MRRRDLLTWADIDWPRVLTDYRRRERLGTDEAAEIVGVTPSAWSRWCAAACVPAETIAWRVLSIADPSLARDLRADALLYPTRHLAIWCRLRLGMTQRELTEAADALSMSAVRGGERGRRPVTSAHLGALADLLADDAALWARLWALSQVAAVGECPAERLTAWLDERGATPYALAALLGVPPSRVESWCAGRDVHEVRARRRLSTLLCAPADAPLIHAATNAMRAAESARRIPCLTTRRILDAARALIDEEAER